MRIYHRKTGVTGVENSVNVKAGNFDLPYCIAPNLVKSADPEFSQNANQSLKRAMAAVDEAFPVILEGAEQQRADDIAIGNLGLEEKLEEELASNFHSTTASLYMPDLNDSGKLEKVTQSVSNGCENLRAACSPPQEPGSIYLRKERREVNRTNDSKLFLFKSEFNRIKGGLFILFSGTFGLSLSKITAALLITLAAAAGIHTYNNPDNPLQLALLSKIDQFTKPQNTTEPTKFASSVNASAVGFALIPELDIATVQLENQVSPRMFSKGREFSEFAGNNGKTATLPVVSIVSTNDIDVTQSTGNKEKNSQNHVDQATNLSERFERGVRPAVSNKVVPEKLELKPEVEEVIDLSNSVLQTALLKTRPVTNIQKRNRADVGQSLLIANVGGALVNNVQLQQLISKLSEGECVSPALSSVFGDSKVSPVFVHHLLKNLENGC